MSEPFMAEIRQVGFNFAPRGWALCWGQLMSINQYTALFSLLGITYGGDGETTFALPDLRGQFAVAAGQGPGLSPRSLGESGGSESVTLLESQMPSHSHVPLAAVAPGDAESPAGASWAQSRHGRVVENAYTTSPGNASMSPLALGVSGGSQAHENMPPYLTVNYIIALQGIFPQRP